MSAVDVGHKVRLGSHLERLQSLRDHQRPQVGPPDPNVDDVSDGLAGIPLPFPGNNLVAKPLHVVQDPVDLGHDVLAVDDDGSVASVPEGDVEHRSVLGEVDRHAREHGVSSGLDVARLGQIHQQIEHLLVDPVLGKVEQNLAVIWRL